jgi:hypothetical protein
MVDAAGEAVVVHREPAATPQIWRDRLARRVRIADIMIRVSLIFMFRIGNSYELFRRLSYSRVEIAVDTRRRWVKLWFTTANRPQRRRCREISPPEG